MPLGSGSLSTTVDKQEIQSWMEYNGALCLRIESCSLHWSINALADIAVAVFNVGGIWELTCTYRCLEGVVTGCGPGWMVDKQIAQSLVCWSKPCFNSPSSGYV